MQRIVRLCERALGGSRQVIAVVGGSGIGKTRLVDDVLGLVPAAEVRRASGDPDEVNLAYGVVDQLGLLEQAVSAGREHAEPSVVGDALVAALGDAEAPPLVLVLEDAQWMDRPSLQALTFALRRLGTQPLVALVTTRDPASLPAGLWRLCEGPSGSVVRPSPLSLAEARDALRQWGRRAVSEPVLERLMQRTDGNPRHLRLLLEQSGPQDHLDPRQLPSGATTELDDAVEARHRELSEDAQAIVQAAAVHGSGAPPALLGAVAMVPSTGPPLEEAVDAGLLRSPPSFHGAVEIEHATRAAIYHRMAPSRRAELHRRIAGHLDDERSRLRHLLAAAEGYDPDVAARSAALAARDAASGAWHAAAEWELGAARCDPSADRRMAARRRAARALVIAGEPAAAEEVLGSEQNPDEPGEVTLLRARIAASRGDLRRATELLEAAWRSSRQDRAATAAAAASHLAAIELADARGDEAARWARRALAADAADVGLTDVDPYSRLTLSLLIAGRLDEARRVTAPRAQERPDPRTDGTFGRAVVASLSGSLPAARAALAELADRSRRSGPLPLWAFVQCWRSALAFRNGDWDDASTESTRATVAADHESWSFAAVAHACLSVPLAGRGEWEHAEHALGEARAAARAAGEPRLVGASITAAAAWLAFVRDDHRAVLRLTDDLADAAFAHVPMLAGPPLTALRGLAAVRAGDAGILDAAVKALDAHPGVPSTWWAGALTAFRLGMDGGSVTAAEALGAAARSVDEDHPVDRALLRLEEGAALRRAGRRAEAAAALEAAATTFEALGAVPFLDRVDAERAMLGRRRRRRAIAPGGLTPSEHAVADLAAQGWSNKEIAADLVLSVKTVEFHLSNVFRKLEVANRTQLANLRGGRGAP